MSAHASQAFSITHCTDSEDLPKVIKEYVQWRPQQLPDLIQKLRELVTCQYVEADQAICGRGDLMLVPALARHRLTVDVWRTISPIQRQKASDACFKALAHAS